jgi:hypothetical protein
MAARPASTQGQKVYRLFYPKELNVETQVAAGDGFGQAGTCLGDLENDGLPEVIATAPSDDSGGADLGAAYVLGFVGDCSNQTLRGDCNATASDGCETTLTSMDSCGACGRSCSGAPNSTGGSCSAAGNCDLSCVDHFGDCNGDVRDGCETDLRTSVDHCGACATKCAVRNHALPVCNAGTCGVGTTCQTPWSDCNANPSDGCEACGSCNQENTTSAPAGAIPPAAPCLPSQVCQQQFYYPPGPNYPYGRCVTVCALGRGDCNGIASDGCEANLTLQTQCGACGPNTGCGVWSFLDYCVLNDTATGYECR